MKTISKIFLSALIGLLFAFGFDALFLDLFNRETPDQVLLLVIPAAAFGFLVFTSWEEPRKVFQKPTMAFFQTDKILSFVKENFSGILLALVFFFAYFYIGLILNPARVDTVDNYLDADNSSWMRRIADPNGGQLEMRGPHPFAYLIFRPFGFLLNFFTKDFALSAITLNVLAGALCVFLVWFYFKRHTQNALYSLLIGSLLGLSTSQFFFSSVVETYIFSSLLLILFFVILQKNETSIRNLVFVGLVTFGITLTNFVQAFIGFFVSRPRIRESIRFAGLTISFGVIASLIHSALYPSSKLFFLPTDAGAEDEFFFSVFREPSWRVIGRIILLIRTVLLYTVVAPKPYVFTTEVGGTFPRFNFFKVAPETFSYSSYNGLGNILIITWSILLFIAGLLFIIDLIRIRKFDVRLGFVLCVLFNFALHFLYGYEPFLYSPDWAYALILFVGLSFAPFSRNKILQVGMFVFLVGLTVNQWQFFEFIFRTIAPYAH